MAVTASRFGSLLLTLLALACSRPKASASTTPDSGAARISPTSASRDTSPAVRGDSLARLRADSARIQGHAGAPLWIIEVSDFQCPFCRQWHESVYPTVVKEYVQSGKARLAYINFPLPSHAYSRPAAELAMCAAAQGKFWPMHDSLFSTQGRWEHGDLAVFDSLGRDVGLNEAQLRACLDRHQMQPLVQADYDRAVDAGVGATPTFIIGSTRINGAQPLEEFRKAVDAELAKASKTAK